jgi:hypothetical protein
MQPPMLMRPRQNPGRKNHERLEMLPGVLHQRRAEYHHHLQMSHRPANQDTRSGPIRAPVALAMEFPPGEQQMRHLPHRIPHPQERE